MLTERERQASAKIGQLVLVAHEARLSLDSNHHDAARRHLGRVAELAAETAEMLEDK